ncbi:hypothetical protein MXB02_06995 [Pseudomonas mosselii]|uniref:hypothetical protein n=1 Tax=Pseudomonas mosselii TaxID=78327 RepID=UPI000BB4F066|nr:hypothetical protein [Pseudomonas mosselii]ATB64165.1 hypothetical protein CLJ08_05890 [Pseudomonas mosselii]UPF05374.1 hypothetical protein MXB02_06995 [Pseudomonas mosselii]
MIAQPQTVAHSFANQGLHEVLEAIAEIPIHESLDAAIYRLEAVLGGIRELMQQAAVSNKATLVYFAAESALALVIAAHAGVAPSCGGEA